MNVRIPLFFKMVVAGMLFPIAESLTAEPQGGQEAQCNPSDEFSNIEKQYHDELVLTRQIYKKCQTTP